MPFNGVQILSPLATGSLPYPITSERSMSSVSLRNVSFRQFSLLYFASVAVRAVAVCDVGRHGLRNGRVRFCASQGTN